MMRLSLFETTPTAPEIAILKISGAEHESLHKDGLRWVKDNHVFTRPVKALELIADAPATPAGGEWTVVVVHLPSCVAKACCIAI